MSSYDFENFIVTAIKKGNIDKVHRRWQPHYKDQRLSGETALHRVCYHTSGDRGELVRILVSFGCDIEAQTYNDGWRPLHLYAIYGRLEAMHALLESGCCLSPLDNHRQTPLMMADRFERHECASLLRSFIEATQRPSKTNYVECDLLGTGAFGCVYKCYDPNIEMYFSIKKVHLSEPIVDVENEEIKALDNAKHIEDKKTKALENESNIYKECNFNKRIVRYFGTTIHKGEMIIFMEYVSNGSLKDKLNKSGPFSMELVTKYSKQILEGLEFLHEHKIIHRDIKASNILRDSKNDIKLADFGISKCMKSISSGSKGFAAAGTPHWMAPEVIKAEENKRYDYRADVWSLGATILELLTGKPPYHELSVIQAMYKIANGAPVDPYFPSNLDKKTKSFLQKIFVHDPSERADVKTLLESSFFQDSSQHMDTPPRHRDSNDSY